MNSTTSILVGEISDYSWIKIQGRGDFLLTPCVKSFVEQLDTDNFPNLVVDLEDCTYMDSTFMGMLAGLAIKQLKRATSRLQVFKANERNCDALEELGIDALMDINSDESQLDDLTLEDRLKEWAPETQQKPNRELLLDCHQNISQICDKNQKTFDSVIETLEHKSTK